MNPNAGPQTLAVLEEIAPMQPSPTRRPARLWTLLFSAALLAGCATTPVTTTAPTEPVTVRLIAFNDLHGHLEGTGLTLPWPDPSDKAKVQRLNARSRPQG